jgi:uncharacterized protein (DUF2147 family)
MTIDLKRLALAALMLALPGCGGSNEVPRAALDSAGQNGRWLTASGNLEVEIKPCEKALCGTVVRVVANNSMAHPGETMTAVDTRPALGMTILSGFTPSGDGEWAGEIYNRENGKTYSCMMALVGPDELRVRPYKVIPLFGQTQIWHRVSAPAG